jgi:hypothetical protein
LDALVDALNAVAGCVTAVRLTAVPNAALEPGGLQKISFGRVGIPAHLRAKAGGQSGLSLDVHHWVTTGRRGDRGSRPMTDASTIAYEYRLLDRDEVELLVFHWQPGSGFSGPDFPHVHVSAALTAQVTATHSQRLPLDKRHIPTGLITLADVVRMLIAEFGVAERHRDWPRRLDRAESILRRSFPEQA